MIVAAIAFTLAVAFQWGVSGQLLNAVKAQDSSSEVHFSDVRIAAQRLEDGRTEFSLEVGGNIPAERATRLFPDPRFLRVDTGVGSWKNSGTLDLQSGYVVRISARVLKDGRVEFALQELGADREWSERILPQQRFVAAYTAPNRWLFGSYVRIPQPVHTPVINELGRFSYLGSYKSYMYGGTIISNVDLHGPGSAPELGVTCQYDTLSVSLYGLPRVDAPSYPVTLTFADGSTVVEEWRRYTATILASPSPRRHMKSLSDSSSVIVEIPNVLVDAYELDLSDMFDTPIQGNLAHCGHYVSGEVVELPLPEQAYDTGTVRGINGGESKIVWHWYEDPVELLGVTLRETFTKLRTGGADEMDEIDKLYLEMSCGERGVLVFFGGYALRDEFNYSRNVQSILSWQMDDASLDVSQWARVYSTLRATDPIELLRTWREGARLQVSLSDETEEILTFDLGALFDTPAQSAFDECLYHTPKVDKLPISGDGVQVLAVPGLSYEIGNHVEYRVGPWTRVLIREQGVWSGQPTKAQELILTCGYSGISVELSAVGAHEPVFLRGWPSDVDVSWQTEEISRVGRWDVMRQGAYGSGYSLSPQDDDAFFREISGAELLLVTVSMEPYPVTLSFGFAELGAWEIPAITNLDACR